MCWFQDNSVCSPRSLQKSFRERFLFSVNVFRTTFCFALYLCISAANECPTNEILRGANGTFTSPGFPSSYPNSVTCTWIIEVPNNYYVELTFNVFQLETCVIPLRCTCDHVEIRDGRSASSPELETFCGSNKPSSLQSSGRYLWVEFKSDWRTTRRGFDATFKAVSRK